METEIEDEVHLSNWAAFVHDTVSSGLRKAKEFKAGGLKEHLDFWKSITFDPAILNLVTGAHIELESNPGRCDKPKPYKFSVQQGGKITWEIQKMLKKGIIEKVADTHDVFVSNIFTRLKSDGNLRVILDLSKFNKHVTYRHFKMESIQNAMDLMSPSCYMASVDWKDAYYCVPIPLKFRKYLVFKWDNDYFQYTCLPNGLASAPRVFTRLSKVLFSELRKQGLMSTSYIDDSLLIAKTLSEARLNVLKTVQISTAAGFVVHPEKSVLHPAKVITYLGFVLNSETMTIRITTQRALKIKKSCQLILSLNVMTVHKFSKTIGLMVASFQGVKYGKLHYRRCDNHKTKVLKEGKGNFQTRMKLNAGCKDDLLWWVQNIESAFHSVVSPTPEITLETDASAIGWGACVRGDRMKRTGGKWSKDESRQHINYLELLAVWLGIQCFVQGRKNACIKVLSDNTTTVAYLNHMGGTKRKCNALAYKIWSWCEINDNWIVAAHIPGVKNVAADRESRNIRDNMEWQLCPEKFREICGVLGTPHIDLFATRLNHQLPRYMAWKPDPGAVAVDAFTEPWGNLFAYIFPPFNLISRVLKKIETERVSAVVIVPYWPTQSWFPKFLKLCIDPPCILSNRRRPLLSHPRRDNHELPKTKLLVGLTYAQPFKTRTFPQPQGEFSWPHGKAPPGSNMNHTCGNGISCVWKGTWIQLLQI